MLALIIIIAILTLIALTPIGATARYNHAGATVQAKIAFFKITLYPMKLKKKKKVKEKEEKKPEKPKEPKEDKQQGGSIVGLKEILPLALRAGSRFKRALTINHLTIYFTAAAGDAYTTTMEFNAAWAAIGIITPAIENNFNVRQRDIRAYVDYTSEKPSVYASATLTIRIWQILSIVFGFGGAFLKLYFKNKKEKAVQ